MNALTLAETQQGLALALASIEAGFVATDREGRVTRLNDEAARVLGWTEAETRRQQEEERLRRVVEASPNGILLVDIQGRIALANHRASRMRVMA